MEPCKSNLLLIFSLQKKCYSQNLQYFQLKQSHFLHLIAWLLANYFSSQDSRLIFLLVSGSRAPDSPPFTVSTVEGEWFSFLFKTNSWVAGGQANLPCDISSGPSTRDSVYLVLWYRKDSGTPIYSYDSRTGDEKTKKNIKNRFLTLYLSTYFFVLYFDCHKNDNFHIFFYHVFLQVILATKVSGQNQQHLEKEQCSRLMILQLSSPSRTSQRRMEASTLAGTIVRLSLSCGDKRLKFVERG